MAGNPRIDELRKKVEKDPASRLFAQLAEELRKDGELEEAIRVSRDGLQKHPNYPSARMTLGRALVDGGDWGTARSEFELVLKGAPDNILASRFLGECLENLGDKGAAVARYKATLVLAPGDKIVTARLQELEGGSPASAVTTGPAPAAAAASSGSASVPPARPVAEEPASTPVAALPSAVASVASEPAPIPLVDADEDFELERPYEAPTGAPHEPVMRAFQLESAHEAPGSAWQADGGGTSTPSREGHLEPHAPSVVDEDFERDGLRFPETPGTSRMEPSLARLPQLEPAPALETEVEQDIEPEVEPEPAVLPEAKPTASGPIAPAHDSIESQDSEGVAAAGVSSPTLAELYYRQGFPEKALEVYRQIAAREPGNERARQRASELERELVLPEDPKEAHRVKVLRTIARLERFLAALRRE